MEGMRRTNADIELNILNTILCTPHLHRFSNVVAQKPLFPWHLRYESSVSWRMGMWEFSFLKSCSYSLHHLSLPYRRCSLVGMECNYWASVAYASRHFSCLAGGLRNYDGGIDVDRKEGIFFKQQGLQLKMTRAVLSYFHDIQFFLSLCELHA